MSPTTIDVIRGLPTPSTWAIGTYATPDGVRDFRITHADLERDTRWATTVLGSHGVGRGSHAVVISAGWEAPWFWPVARAVQRLGAVYSACDIWPFDAHRTELFLRRLPIDAVIGINDAIAAELAEMGDIGSALAGLRLLAGRPDAIGRLRRAGLSPALIAPVGPALAFQRADDSGAQVNAEEWQLRDVTGTPTLSTIADRGHRIVDEPQTLDHRLVLHPTDGSCEIRSSEGPAAR